jgi:penicillin-insensitive murein DD-endopeptidase
MGILYHAPACPLDFSTRGGYTQVMRPSWIVLLLLLASPARASLEAELPPLELDGLLEGLKAPPVPFLIPGSPANPWRSVKTPSRGPALSIGGYSAGCLKGALPMPESSEYLLMRPSRNRHYAHPDLVRVLSNAAAQAKAFGLLTIGDLAMPRGGPTMTGHMSHQNGLDADVWYWLPKPGTTLSREERETISAPNVVIPEFIDVNKKTWNPKAVEVLKFVAEQPETERILVNPVVKREACRAYGGKDWVGKLRPFWGHDDHFHMRLRCPAGDAACKAQEPPPPGDGCGAELAEWFTEERRREGREQRGQPTPPKMPVLPELCAEVLKD